MHWVGKFERFVFSCVNYVKYVKNVYSTRRLLLFCRKFRWRGMGMYNRLIEPF